MAVSLSTGQWEPLQASGHTRPTGSCLSRTNLFSLQHCPLGHSELVAMFYVFTTRGPLGTRH